VPPIEIRPFHRRDRDQLTRLVNAHIDAVVPGISVSPNTVLGQLEREPDEYVVDPWVCERHTLVAVHRDRIAGAAHLLRYADGERVSAGMRGLGELRWCVFWPGQHGRARVEMIEVADALVAAAVAHLRGSARIAADGGLPAPGVYGIPDRWPHVAAALERAGFVVGEREEAVLAARVDDLPEPGPPPLPELTMQVALGGHATRFSALRDGEVVGMYEVNSDLTAGGTHSRLAGWADAEECWVRPDLRRRGVATWLLGHAADRLRFAGARRLLEFAITVPEGEDEGSLEFLLARGFRELTRTRRDWSLTP
jgi:GNAT superfamily N-acetyltransferase